MQKVILQILVGLHLIAFLLIGIFIHSQKHLSYVSVKEVKDNSKVGVKNNCKNNHKSTYFNKTNVKYNLGPRFFRIIIVEDRYRCKYESLSAAAAFF